MFFCKKRCIKKGGNPAMSIDYSGINDKLKSATIEIEVDEKQDLIKLANALEWERLAQIVLLDLKDTPKQQWWRGRSMQLRTHLGVYVLQQLLNETDREMERQIKANAVYQMFCGKTTVDKWRCPAHTKIEEFRSRLSPETQKKLANEIAVLANKLKFARAKHCDIDSTVQEANMTYPSDASLLVKLGCLTKKVVAYCNRHVEYFCENPLGIDFKAIKSKARAYFFSGIKQSKDLINRPELRNLWECVAHEIRPMLDGFEMLTESDWKEMPWNIRRAAYQVKEQAAKYIEDVGQFLSNGKMQKGKILSFYLKEVAYFEKKAKEKSVKFGRHFQIGRIEGNFLFIASAEDVRFHDKEALRAMIGEHEKLFGKGIMESISVDRGYFSQAHESFLVGKNIKEISLPCPCNVRAAPLVNLSPEMRERLVNRRAGIEPLIGHLKNGWQMGRSRMKSDNATKAAGYCSVLGFNLRQLMGKLANEALPSIA
jgi:transposase, IS5 family